MHKTPLQSPDRIFILMVIVIVIDLFMTGNITWSKWPVMALLAVYFLNFIGAGEHDSRAIELLKERYAKGELSEEEFLRQKRIMEEDYARTHGSGPRYFIGALLIVLGFFLLFGRFIHFPLPLLPVILIVVGIFAIVHNLR